jgi:CheY-like chemotaxis protein
MDRPKILVVDDDKETALALEGYFQAKGYPMLTALSGERTLRLLETEQPALVLLDVQMPKIDGIAVLKTIKEKYPQIKVIIMTAYKEYKEKVKQLGADGFLEKPLSLSLFNQKINELLPKEKVGKVNLLFVEFVPEFWESYTSKQFKDFYPELFEIDKVIQVPPDRSDKILEKLNFFKPDLVLINVSLAFISNKIVFDIQNSQDKPKDIILYGGKPAMTTIDEQDMEKTPGRRLFTEKESLILSQDYWDRLKKTLIESAIHLGLIERTAV